MSEVGINHPSALMAEAKREREVVDTAEAQALMAAIFRAVSTYRDYLDCHGLFYDDDRELMLASGLRVTCDINGEMEIILKDGPIDRLYGDGEDPDPFGTLLTMM
jgi:hypothetical protein